MIKFLHWIGFILLLVVLFYLGGMLSNAALFSFICEQMKISAEWLQNLKK